MDRSTGKHSIPLKVITPDVCTLSHPHTHTPSSSSYSSSTSAPLALLLFFLSSSLTPSLPSIPLLPRPLDTGGVTNYFKCLPSPSFFSFPPSFSPFLSPSLSTWQGGKTKASTINKNLPLMGVAGRRRRWLFGSSVVVVVVVVGVSNVVDGSGGWGWKGWLWW